MLQKNHSLCSIWCRSVNPIPWKENLRTSETCSAAKYVYFRSCIIRQWLGFFWGCFIMNWSRLLPLFSSKESEPAERPGGGCLIWGTEVWKAFSRHPWLLGVLIHYTFPNTLSIFVFHLQSVCELPMWFQTGNCFNWMDSWCLILMFCTKR